MVEQLAGVARTAGGADWSLVRKNAPAAAAVRTVLDPHCRGPVPSARVIHFHNSMRFVLKIPVFVMRAGDSWQIEGN